MHKKCSKCKKEKPLSEFYPDKHQKDKRHNRCKQCAKDWYMQRRAKVLLWNKHTECGVCGKSLTFEEKIHFHHLDPSTKKFEIWEAYSNDHHSDEEIKAELSKTIPLHHWCHFLVEACIKLLPLSLDTLVRAQEIATSSNTD